MVGGDGFRSVGEHVVRFPSGTLGVVVLVTGPLDEVTKLASVILRVEDLADFEFLVVVDDDGRRRRLFPSGNAIRVSGFQEGDVEDGMKGGKEWRKVELHGERRNDLDDLEGS